MTTGFEPRIYVACLAAYNNGYLHGSWIDATDDLERIQDQVNAMLEASPISDAEEYAIHDYEGFGGADIGEYAGLARAHELALFVEEHQGLGALVLEHVSGDLEDARTMLERYSGTYTSGAAFAEEYVEQWYEIPEQLAYYIDYDAMARSLQLGGEIETVTEGFEEVHIFWGQ
ncbi:antirestriction protein ArdA [Maricaulis alexandrii]|uniref:antirestriction protein ArdA n=1 Tax=Maricaulis alexandrii TaxID=2570354 RepID=UPI001109C647|nr:antirestriction protein ArdA [Maricaulis alexandrii]MCR9178595.1 antirestriction protein ArdA [Alphaproteobacteria bacterium]